MGADEDEWGTDSDTGGQPELSENSIEQAGSSPILPELPLVEPISCFGKSCGADDLSTIDEQKSIHESVPLLTDKSLCSSLPNPFLKRQGERLTVLAVNQVCFFRR